MPDAFPDDQSFYSPVTDSIQLGTGGVDDAEDADIIWHEYGHAIQDDVIPGFGFGGDADTIVLESHFAFTPDISFAAARQVTVDTALRLFGDDVARVVQQAFEARGLLADLDDRGVQPRHPQGPPKLREIARLNDPAPGGGRCIFDFEPYGLSDDATALYSADVTTGGEGMFVNGRTGVSQILRSRQPAPGGGTFGIGVQPAPSMNRGGEVAMAFFLQPFLRRSAATSACTAQRAAP